MIMIFAALVMLAVLGFASFVETIAPSVLENLFPGGVDL